MFVVVSVCAEDHHAGRAGKWPLLDRSRSDAAVVDPHLWTISKSNSEKIDSKKLAHFNHTIFVNWSSFLEQFMLISNKPRLRLVRG